jgi:hypothetical protein
MNLSGLIIISYAFKLALLEVLLTYWFHHKTRLQYQVQRDIKNSI